MLPQTIGKSLAGFIIERRSWDKLMLEGGLRVENEKRELQEARNQPKRARELDLEQTLDEQAYASALASR